MESSFTEAQQRWQAFLTKIETRFHETLTQCENLLPNILELRDFDTTAFAVAWQGVESQAQQLISRIDDTWQNKVLIDLEKIKEDKESTLEEDGDTAVLENLYNTIVDTEFSKGERLANKLERELKSYGVRTCSEAARKLSKKASEVLSKSFLCTQCKAPLQLKQNFFRSYYQTCEYCQTVNTFEPGSIARNVEHFALHPLAEEKSLTEYFIYLDAEEKFKNQRDDEPAHISWREVLEAYSVYIKKYLQARIEIIPEYEKEYEKDYAAKIEQVRKALSPHEASIL